MLSSPCSALIYLAMALSQHGSLPDPTANTEAHFIALPRRLHTLEEATNTGGLLVREVDSAKGLDPSPTLIHIDMREPECADALRKKGCGHKLVATAVAGPPRVEGRPPLSPPPKRLTRSWGSCLCMGQASSDWGFAPSTWCVFNGK